MTDIVDLIKEKVRIEDVIEQDQPLRKSGRYWKGQEHSSLVVDIANQCYYWNSRAEHGDVIAWIEKRKGWDFKSSVEYLAQQANLPTPDWGNTNVEERISSRAREDALTVAARVFVKRLQASTAAQEYCLWRGWTEETIELAGLGFTGTKSPEETKELKGELSLYSHDWKSGAGKAVLNLPAGMLVYPHVYGGRVRYLSLRSIKRKKHYNLPRDLVGPRKMYFNHAYQYSDDLCVLVEGQADAVTLGQWGIPAVATAGTSFEDSALLLIGLRERHKGVFIGLDNDVGGEAALRGNRNDWPLSKVLGPMARVLRWPRDPAPVKDANEFLQLLIKDGVQHDDQILTVNNLLDNSSPLIIEIAEWVGNLEGYEKDDGDKLVFDLIASMDELEQARYRKDLSSAIGLPLREYNHVLKAAANKPSVKEGESDRPEIIIETLKEWLPIHNEEKSDEECPPKGWLIEYVYNKEKDQGLLAYRNPEGEVGIEPYLDILGIRYAPKTPNSLIKEGGVLFPSGLGKLKRTRDIVKDIEAFIHRYFLLDDQQFGRMASYYVLLTWLYDCFNAIPYLRAQGDYGSGKSELMKRIGHVCYRMMSTSGAGSSSSLFRALDQYRGTAFMDEMDLRKGGDMTNDLIKILNQGAMDKTPVWRLSEFMRPDGTKDWDVAIYKVYGPKLIAMRKEFGDKAVTSRCLTTRLTAKEPIELKRAGIPLHLNQEFYLQAENLRNLLLRWRLEMWRPEIEVGEDLMDLSVPARLNQVTMPLKAIAKNDPELLKDVEAYVRKLNEELILERQTSLESRVLDALITIREKEGYEKYLFRGKLEGIGDTYYTFPKYVAKVANEIMDDMNLVLDDIDEDDSPKRRTRGTTAKTVGMISRNDLQLRGKHTREGNAIIYNDDQMELLKVKFGLMSLSEIDEITGISTK